MLFFLQNYPADIFHNLTLSMFQGNNNSTQRTNIGKVNFILHRYIASYNYSNQAPKVIVPVKESIMIKLMEICTMLEILGSVSTLSIEPFS